MEVHGTTHTVRATEKLVEVDPLKKEGVAVRRKRRAWTIEEIQKLIIGVQRHGKGNWAVIHSKMEFDSSRTATDLKDKWRNLVDVREKSKTPSQFKEIAVQINQSQESKPVITDNKSEKKIDMRVMEKLQEIYQTINEENAQELVHEILELKNQ